MTFSTPVTYTHHLTNRFGCDSSAILHLSVFNPTTSTTNASICTGNSYIFNGNTYTTSGSFTIHLLNYHGCDSAATLVLSVSTGFTPAVQITTTTTAVCTGSIVTFVATPTNGGSSPLYQWYKNFSAVGSNQPTYIDNSLNTADVITCTMTSNLTCVNIGTNPAQSNALTMTVNHPSSSVTTTSICQGDSFLFAGTYYKVANTYLVHLSNYVNCDSAATLHLTIKQASSSTTNASICNGDNYTFNNNTYSIAGNYLIHILNAAGCDSAATLNLTVTTVDTSSVITNNSSITANQNGASYQWYDCTTGVAIANATSQIFTPAVSGNYKCVITLNGCNDTTSCKSINSNVGILEHAKWNNENLQISPNPCMFFISINSVASIKLVQIYDLTGRVCLSMLNPKSENINVSFLLNGIYFIKATTANGSIQSAKFIKL
jgi:hypothetical protein